MSNTTISSVEADQLFGVLFFMFHSAYVKMKPEYEEPERQELALNCTLKVNRANGGDLMEGTRLAEVGRDRAIHIGSAIAHFLLGYVNSDDYKNAKTTFVDSLEKQWEKAGSSHKGASFQLMKKKKPADEQELVRQKHSVKQDKSREEQELAKKEKSFENGHSVEEDGPIKMQEPNVRTHLTYLQPSVYKT